jgi:hypothetical protein
MTRVERLIYGVTFGQFVVPEAPLTFSYATDDFRVEITGENAILYPLGDFATEDDARVALEGFLRAWEITAGAAHRYPVFQFQFQGSRIEAADGSGSVTASREVPTTASVVLGLTAFPPPPLASILSPWVTAIWNQVRGFRERETPLVAAAYMVLTILEASTAETRHPREHKRAAVARIYGLVPADLKRLGELTAVSDLQHGRKVGQGRPSPLTGPELTFIQQMLHSMLFAAVAVEGLA